MLKRFFISMLGAMAGLWLSLFILVFVGLIALGVVLGSVMSKNVSTVGSDSVLYLKLEGEVAERQPDFSMDNLLNLDFADSDNLADMLNAVRIAASDKDIKGIYIDGIGSSMGLASRTELLQALEEFKKSGKWIYAYADEFQQGDYYLASAADKIVLNPVGMLDVHGLASNNIFFKDLLDKLGVRVQVVKVGEFKSAVEPFIRTSMSEPSRLQTTVFLTNIWTDMVADMARNRGVEAADVNFWADSMSMTWDPQKYVDAKMVTDLMYRHDFEQMLRKELGLKAEKELPLVSPADYMAARSGKLGAPEKKHIAVLYAVGDITQDGHTGIVSNTLVPQIYELIDNDKVRGLVLRVNSGGGSAFASEQIWKALQDFKATGRPLYVSMGDYAASGGYYISCGADKIYADATTITGSIGIFGLIPDAQGLITDKLALHIETVETNPNADFPTYIKPMTPAQHAAMQKYVERGYATFTQRVADGRNLPIDSVYAIGGGRVWDGSSALRIGLVDELGSLQQAIEGMARATGLSANACVAYPPIKDKWMSLLLGDDANKIQLLSPEMAEYLRAANAIKDLDPIQARMEYIIVK